MLVHRIGRHRELRPFATPGDAADLGFATHMLCCSWAICFSAPSSENVQGSINLASKTAPPGSTTLPRVAAIHLMTGCWIRR